MHLFSEFRFYPASLSFYQFDFIPDPRAVLMLDIHHFGTVHLLALRRRVLSISLHYDSIVYIHVFGYYRIPPLPHLESHGYRRGWAVLFHVQHVSSFTYIDTDIFCNRRQVHDTLCLLSFVLLVGYLHTRVKQALVAGY